jgi:hypothetical protein
MEPTEMQIRGKMYGYRNPFHIIYTNRSLQPRQKEGNGSFLRRKERNV